MKRSWKNGRSFQMCLLKNVEALKAAASCQVTAASFFFFSLIINPLFLKSQVQPWVKCWIPPKKRGIYLNKSPAVLSNSLNASDIFSSTFSSDVSLTSHFLPPSPPFFSSSKLLIVESYRLIIGWTLHGQEPIIPQVMDSMLGIWMTLPRD